jgi:hypothetical protein
MKKWRMKMKKLSTIEEDHGLHYFFCQSDERCELENEIETARDDADVEAIFSVGSGAAMFAHAIVCAYSKPSLEKLRVKLADSFGWTMVQREYRSIIPAADRFVNC